MNSNWNHWTRSILSARPARRCWRAGIAGILLVLVLGDLLPSVQADGPFNDDSDYIGTDAKNTYSLAWGDVDGDGDLDLAVGNKGVNQVFENVGGTLNQSPLWESEDAKYTASVAWGDVDGDGDLDLAVGNIGEVNQVFENIGGTLSQTPLWENALDDTKYTFSMVWGDVDGDGNLDLAVGNFLQVNQVFKNVGGTLNRIPLWESDDAKYTTSVAWGDVDGDGDIDLAVGNEGQVNQIFENEGETLSKTPLWQSNDTKYTTSVAWGDVNGDGDLDLAIGNKSQVNQVFENGGETLSQIPLWESAPDDTKSTFSVALGDVDGDGDLDLVVGNSGVNLVFENVGETLNQIPLWESDDAKSTFSVALGDVDGDGDLDLAVGNSGVNLVFENERGILSQVPLWEGDPDDTKNTVSVAWGDMNGDGDLDLAVGNSGVNYVFENVGGTLSQSPQWKSSNAKSTRSVAWGDVDGDGDLDLAVGNSAQVNQIFENEGGILSQTPLWESDDTKFTNSVAWGDVDGDDDLDLAIGNGKYGEGQVSQVYENKGGTLSQTPLWENDDREFTYSVAWGDVDGDGDLDLAVGNYTRVNWVFENVRGTLSRTPLWESAPDDTKSTYSVVWGDVDGDGDLDLAVGNEGQVNQVFENVRGTLSRTPLWESAPDDTKDTSSVAWGDVDGDGNLDLVVGNSSYEVNQIFENTRLGGQNLANNFANISPGHPYISSANFYAHEQILDNPIIPITYTLFDPEGDPVGDVQAFYSLNGGGGWQPAVASTDTLTTNLSTGRWLNRAVLTPTRAIPNTGLPFSANLAITGNAEIAKVEVWLSITHTNNADLAVTLQSPGGTRVPLLTTSQASGQNFAHTHFADDVTTTLILSSTAPYTGTYQPAGNLSRLQGQAISGTWTLSIADSNPLTGTTGALVAWGLRLKTSPMAHVFTWDTFASGFFGQSDNVVLRLVAHPQPAHSSITGTYKYTNNTPGPFQQGYASATTFPFRVRGTQVRVYSETIALGNEAEGAIVYRLLKDQSTGGFPLTDAGGAPFRTDHRGYLRGRGQIGLDDRLFAMLPVHSALNYEGALEFDGEDDYVIRPHLYNAPITATTISFWMRSEDTTGGGTLFSYASPLADDTFLVTNYNCRGDGISVTTGITATDDDWHHIAITWRSSDDQIKLYKDGVVSNTKILTATWRSSDDQIKLYRDGAVSDTKILAAGSVISPEGSLVLGKDHNGENFFAGTLDEVRVWNIARSAAEIKADMYRPLQGDEPGLIAYWPFNDPADPALDRTANGNDASLHGAIWDGDFYGGYTVYHTSAAPINTGLDMFTVTVPGVQVLTVTAKYPLVLFDLNVSLEWDARNDEQFISQLEYDLKRASESLYDWTNGQVALGQVTVYHDQGYWGAADIRVYATNRMRPNANQGGIVKQVLTDPKTSTVTYAPGQVRMGAVWNRYGESSGALGQDWPRALAHELGHYALYLDDNYIGLDKKGRIIPISSEDCPGAMSDPYQDAYSEFHPDVEWSPGCERTLSHQTTGRSDWATIADFYTWLITPTISLTDENFNSGPSLLPLALTQVQFVEPITPTTALEVPIFYLFHKKQHALPEESARAFLFQDERLIDLGGPTRDEVRARGARSGDRLCVYDLAAGKQGCEIIRPGDTQLELISVSDWQPELTITPITSHTTAISVTGVPADELLSARLFPVDGPALQSRTLTYTSEGYGGVLEMDAGVTAAYVQVWAAAIKKNPRREVVANYVLGGNPANWYGSGANWYGSGANWYGSGANWYGSGANWYGSGANWYGSGANWYGSGTHQRAHNAPAISTDGQVILFGEKLDLAADEFFILHATTTPTSTLPPWATLVGQAYRLTLSPNVTDTAVLNNTSLSLFSAP